MVQPVVLVDEETWAEPLVNALTVRGQNPRLVNLRTLPWNADPDFGEWGLVVNRVSARPEVSGGHPAALLRKAQDVLVALELAGVPCIHGSRAYAVGSSKALQVRCFAQVGLRTPATRLLIDGDLEEALVGLDTKQWLLKPNLGAFGTAIGAPDGAASSAAFTMDGMAVLQERIEPGEPFVFRAEFVGERLAYLAASPLEEGETNYCLAGSGAEVRLSRDMPPALQRACVELLQLADMQFGSVEYLVDTTGEPVFIDINPVSSPHPEVKDRLGVDVWAMQAELISDVWERCQG